MFVQLAPTAFIIKKKSSCCRHATTLVADDMVGLQQWFDSAPHRTMLTLAKLGMRSVIAENKAMINHGGVTFPSRPFRNYM